MNGNELVGRMESNALQASVHASDSTPPKLLNFTLDLDLGRLALPKCAPCIVPWNYP